MLRANADHSETLFRLSTVSATLSPPQTHIHIREPSPSFLAETGPQPESFGEVSGQGESLSWEILKAALRLTVVIFGEGRIFESL